LIPEKESRIGENMKFIKCRPVSRHSKKNQKDLLKAEITVPT